MVLGLLARRLPGRIPRRDALAHRRQPPDVERHAPGHIELGVPVSRLPVPGHDLVRLREPRRASGQEPGSVVRRRTDLLGREEVGHEVADVRERVAYRRHLPAVRNEISLLVTCPPSPAHTRARRGQRRRRLTLECQSPAPPSCETQDCQS